MSFFSHEVDHIVAEKHDDLTDATNLALTRWRCNRQKGTDLASFDSETGMLTPLFHPRTQAWQAHVAIQDELLVGLTPEGRTTVFLLKFNTSERIEERQRLLSMGSYGA